MRVTDKINLLENIGVELQKRFSFKDIDTLLIGFSVPKPIDAPMDSKRLYVKTALAGVSNDIILQIAVELGLQIPDMALQSIPSSGNSVMANDSRQLIELRDLIVKNFSAGDWQELGLLTNSSNIIESHPRLLRSLHWGDADYEDVILPVLIAISRVDPNNLMIINSFVRKRAGVEGELVSSGKSSKKTILFQPKVFEIPEAEVEPNLISAMMPFHPGMTPVYTAIQTAAKIAGFRCERADNIWDASAVIQDVFSLIYRSFIVVCDFTGKNPNVFYEAGIAHTLGKHVIPITQSDGDIPFDLRHHRHLSYLGNGEGIAKMQETLATRFKTLDQQR
jgi:hypothetical protein